MIIAIAIFFVAAAAALALVARDWRQLRRRIVTVEEVPVVRVGDIPVVDLVTNPEDEPFLQVPEAVMSKRRHGKGKGKRKDWRKQPKRRRLVPDDAA